MIFFQNDVNQGIYYKINVATLISNPHAFPITVIRRNNVVVGSPRSFNLWACLDHYTTLNIVFSVTYYLDLHDAISCYNQCNF